MNRYLLVLLIGLGLLATLAWRARRRVAFRIAIEHGKLTVASGDPPAEFLNDARSICKMWKIASGTIRGVKRGPNVHIRVSGPATEHEQAFRNAWTNPIRL